MSEEAVQIQVRGAPVDWVSGIWNLPESPDPPALAVLLAHGAGAGMRSAFMGRTAEFLAERGFPVLRFQYAYTERIEREGKQRPPDRQPMLEAVHRQAAGILRQRFPEARIVFAGKSMGGRMGSYLAAEGEDVAALAYLGYPLHPPGKPERLRTDQFPSVTQPSLFLQGTRDALCDLELLRPALETYGGPTTLEVIEGADHSFQVLRSTGLSDDEVLEDVLGRMTTWLQKI
ncbi:MAG: alpha/beta family hydrolase [Planctomycetota bacterium]